MTAFEAKGVLAFPALRAKLHSFARADGPRVVWCDLPGPLCSAYVVVATECWDDGGLPHTLEHLVFCGSRNVPLRGFLDTLANRSLSTGTNAWTAEDHTAYSAVTAGPQGLVRLLPVFLDHILHPTLREPQFLTEVYHIDGEGKEQGVVFCEMSGRENTESDLLENNLRRLLYPGTGLMFECGGSTQGISNLTNESIRAYHAHYYHPRNATIVLCGEMDIQETLRVLDQVDYSANETSTCASLPDMTIARPILPLQESVSKKVDFPSFSDDVASTHYAWHGPRYEDLEAIIAIEVLLRYLMETAASPLAQRFVERSQPLASDVEYEIKIFAVTSIVISFSGIPFDSDEQTSKEDEEEDEEDDDEDEDDEDDENEDDEDFPDDLLAPGVFKELLIQLFTTLTETDYTTIMPNIVRRHRVKYLETLEDEAAELIAGALIQEAINDRTNSCLGERLGKSLTILDTLEHQESVFWSDLLRRWFVEAPCVEVIMTPNKLRADEIANINATRLSERVAQLGQEGLQAKAAIIQHALAENKINLPNDVLATMPPLPLSSTVPVFPNIVAFHWKSTDVIPASMTQKGIHLVNEAGCHDLDLRNYSDIKNNNSENEPIFIQETALKQVDQSPARKTRSVTKAALLPFAIQEVVTDTHFCHVRLCLDTSHVPLELRDYLILFQELLLETDLSIPGRKMMGYRDVVRVINEEVVSLECGVGFGNETFTCAYQDRIFYLYGLAEPSRVARLCEWMIGMLFFAVFTRERLLATTKNLLSDIADMVGGDEIMDVVVIDQTEVKSSNASRISILYQAPFLRTVLSQLKSSNDQARRSVSSALHQLRHSLLSNLSLAFAQISHATTSDVDTTAILLSTWNKHFAAYKSAIPSSSIYSPSFDDRRKRAKTVTGSVKDVEEVKVDAPWPFPRSLYAAKSEETALIVPVQGIDASYLTQLISCPCDISQPQNMREFGAVVLLCELLSRNEGPLYSAIRGQGFAYDCGVSFYKWIGQLVFTCYESSDPQKALAAFSSTLEQFVPEFQVICSPFHMDTARASLIYRSHAARATAGQMLTRALQQSLLGLSDVSVDDHMIHVVETITAAELMEVYQKHFKRFLVPTTSDYGGRVTVITTSPKHASQLCTNLLPSLPAARVCELTTLWHESSLK